MKLLIIVLVLLVVAAGGGAWYWHISSTPNVEYRTAKVQRGDMLSTISATGTIEPEETIDEGAQVNG